MSLSRIMEEVKVARGNNVVPEGVVDILDVLTVFENDLGKEEFNYECYGFNNVFAYLSDINERLMAEDGDGEDWIWPWMCGNFYFSAKKYGISNDIEGRCYSNDKTGDNGVIVVFSIKKDDGEFTCSAGIYFDIQCPTMLDVNFWFYDIISDARVLHDED